MIAAPINMILSKDSSFSTTLKIKVKQQSANRFRGRPDVLSHLEISPIYCFPLRREVNLDFPFLVHNWSTTPVRFELCHNNWVTVRSSKWVMELTFEYIYIYISILWITVHTGVGILLPKRRGIYEIYFHYGMRSILVLLARFIFINSSDFKALS